MIRQSLLALGLLTLGPLAAPAGELPTATPAEVGLDPEELGRIKPGLEVLVEEGQIPGAVALVARHGKIAYVVTVGYRDLESKAPMTEDTIFAIASMSKPITCVAVMTLVEQGKLGLDDPVADYLPALKDLRVLGDPKDDTEETLATVPAERPVTIRDLLSHSSGISYGGALGGALGGDERQARAYDRERVMDRGLKTVAEQVERLGKVPLAHQPGARFTYGLSHDVLGRVIEVVSGQSFDKYLQEHIFTPLDMHDTAFLVPESKRDRLATIYRADDGGKLQPLPRNPGSATFFSGGGGLFSTARDYARFAQMLLNGGELDGARILKAETIALMTTNQIGRNTALGLFKYGLGFGLEMIPRLGREPVLNRYFWGGIFSTNFWIDPRHDLVAIVMTQVLPTNHGNAQLVLRRHVDAAIKD